MAKAVAFDVEARQGLKKGIDTVAQAVRITLGPKGQIDAYRSRLRVSFKYEKD